MKMYRACITVGMWITSGFPDVRSDNLRERRSICISIGLANCKTVLTVIYQRGFNVGDMRTTELKIGNEVKQAILVAGGEGFKIYSASGFEGWVLVVGRKVTPIESSHPDFKTVSRYVNLKYQPASEQDAITLEFKGLVNQQSPPSRLPDAEPTV